ncbi:MAG: hypothetical protein BMS9Abin28_1352 [Anaerolineae bacterium]|nr:MAG: hypothetical protein BMS9Abin28_1352 [Anaerolineae bacterium]
MTSLREAVRRLLSRTQQAAPPDPEYSYTIYWTKMVLDWDAAQRAGALSAVEHLMAQPDFAPTAFERRYQDARIDDTMHSGESLLALHKVLKAFEGDSILGADRPPTNGV